MFLFAVLKLLWCICPGSEWITQILCFSPQCIIGLLNVLCLFVVNWLRRADWLFKSAERPIGLEVKLSRVMTWEWDMSDHDPIRLWETRTRVCVNVVSQDCVSCSISFLHPSWLPHATVNTHTYKTSTCVLHGEFIFSSALTKKVGYCCTIFCETDNYFPITCTAHTVIFGVCSNHQITNNQSIHVPIRSGRGSLFPCHVMFGALC